MAGRSPILDARSEAPEYSPRGETLTGNINGDGYEIFNVDLNGMVVVLTDTGNDDAALSNAFADAALGQKCVLIPAEFTVNYPVDIPAGMREGTIFGYGTEKCKITASATFPTDQPLLRCATSIFRLNLRGFTVDCNNRAITGIDLTRTPEDSIGHTVDGMIIENIPTNGTGIILDGCEDSVLSRTVITRYEDATGVIAVKWHVIGGNIWMQHLITFNPLYLEAQQVTISGSTTGTIVADGVIYSLVVSGVYLYPNATLKANFYNSGSNTFHGIDIIGSYINNADATEIVVFKGKYAGHVRVGAGTNFDGNGTGDYVLFSSATTASSGTTPVFAMEGAPFLSGANLGTPAAGVTIRNDDSVGIAYTPTVSSTTGTVTTYSVTDARYRSIGKRVFVRVHVLISAIGTAGDAIKITLPTGLTPLSAQSLSACVLTTKVGLTAITDESTNAVYLRKSSDGSFYGANGYEYIVTGVYELH